ncbi:hypothetical protein V6Z12_D10G071200 [Gossypium hirsutum]
MATLASGRSEAGAPSRAVVGARKVGFLTPFSTSTLRPDPPDATSRKRRDLSSISRSDSSTEDGLRGQAFETGLGRAGGGRR